MADEPSQEVNASETLEHCRVEVVRRMTEKALPLSLAVSQTVVVDNEDSTGWGTQREVVSISGINNTGVLMAIRDPTSTSMQLLDLRTQLEPLATRLNEETDLGTRPHNFFPNLEGIDAIVTRYLQPMAMRYLEGLADLGQRDYAMATRLSEELDSLVAAKDQVINATQIAVAGINPANSFEHRDISIRRLTQHERGAVADMRLSAWNFRPVPRSDFIPARTHSIYMPTALIEVRVSRPRSQQLTQFSLHNRLALAFFLMGYELSSTGAAASFDLPSWAVSATSLPPFPVSEKAISANRELSENEFAAVVDFAYKIPEFGADEGSGREIVLFRLLRGCGMHFSESGFLDFAIALEAALLSNSSTELSYRFSLYGALFLRGTRDPKQTYDQLRNIYQVRSNLVHGSRVNQVHRQTAEKDARELAIAVVRKSVEDGWPDKETLDRAAIGMQLI